MAFDVNNTTPAPQPPKPVFDPMSAQPVGMPNETLYVESTDEVVEMPTGSLDRIAEISSRGFAKGDIKTDLSKLYFETFMGNVTPEITSQIERLEKSSPGDIKTDGAIEEMFRATSEMVPMLLDVANQSAGRAMQGAMAGGTTGLIFGGLGVVPGFFAGAGAGVLSGMAEQSFVMATGNLFREISNFKDAKGNKIDPMAARITAFAGGAISAGLEAMPMVLLFKLVPGSKKVLGLAADKLGKTLKLPKTTGALKKFALNIATVIASETVTEGAQEGVEIAAGEIAKMTSDLDIPRIKANDALDRVGHAMVEALKATPLIAVGFSAPRLAVDIANGKTPAPVPNGKQDKIKVASTETVDAVSENIKSSPISENMTEYEIDTLDAKQVEELQDAGVEITDRGTLKAEDAELIVAESNRRTDFYQNQMSKIEKETDTAESKALRKVARGRIKKLDSDIKSIDEKIDSALELVTAREAAGLPVKNINNRIDTVLKKREVLDEERANLLLSETPIGKRKAELNATDKDIELKGADLLKAERRVAESKERTMNRAFRSALVVGRKDVKAAQTAIIDIINKSDLPIELRGKFLTAIKNVQTLAQLERGIPRFQAKINEIVTAHRKKKAVKKLGKVLNTTSVKNRKGKFGPEIQSILDVARRAMRKTKEAALESIETRAGNGTQEIPTPTQALENTILMLKADPSSVNLRGVERILEAVTLLMDTGKTIRGGDILAKQTYVKSQIKEILTLMGPPRNETDAQRKRRELGTAIEVNTFLGMSGAWWNKLSRIMRSSDKLKVDKMINSLSLFKESRAFDRGKQSSVKRITELFLNAMNTTSERALWKQLSADETTLVELGSFTHSNGKHELLDVKTRAELRKRVMELKDPQLKESMMNENGNAYTEEIVQALNNEMTELDHRLVDAQLEFYEEYYQRINATYERVYGFSLPKVEFYSPIKRVSGAETVDEFMKGILYRGGVAPGSLKSRQPNIKPIKTMGDLGALHSHISEMEYFIAYSEKVQEIDAIMGSTEVQTGISSLYGPQMLKTIQADLEHFSKRGVQNSIIGEKFFTTLFRNFTFAQLGAKPQIGLKQLSSFSAYSQDVKIKDFTAGIASFAKNPRAALEVLNQSELFRERGSNIDQDYQALLSDKSWINVMGRNPKLAQVMMLPIRLGDKGAIAIGGYAHYFAMKKGGATTAEALQSMENLTVRTQQSSDIDQLSALQRSNSFTRLVTQFMSSANALSRAEYNAILDKSAGRITKKEFAKRIIVLHAVIPMTIQFVANGFNWDNEDQLRASLLGTLNGMFIFGDLIDAAYRKFFSEDGQFFDVESRHPLAFVQTFFEALEEFEKDGITWEEFVEGSKAVDKMTRATGDLTGVPVKTLIGMIRGIVHVGEGLGGDKDDITKGIFEMLGFSSYTIDNKVLE